jgi:uncharacterized membrane protein
MSDPLQAGRIQRATIYLRSSFGFVPARPMLAALLLALGMVQLDRHDDGGLRERWSRLFTADPDGSREMLPAIARSMITVAGVVFSITTVALAQAATQNTSRALRNFMREHFNPVVPGVVVGVFLYCLIVLRAIRASEGHVFVPALAVLAGPALAIVATCFLIVFVHGIAATIQAGEIAQGDVRDAPRSLCCSRTRSATRCGRRALSARAFHEPGSP